MEFGLYEQIINNLFQTKLDSLDSSRFFMGTRKLTNKDVAVYLSKYLLQIVNELFHSFDNEENGVEKCKDLVNDIIRHISSKFDIEDYKNNLIEAEASILTAVIDKTRCEFPDIAEYIKSITPATTLSRSHLFTGHNNGVSLGSELRKEILSSDDICFLVSFIKLSGLNEIEQELKKHVNAGNRLRVITTTYMQATDFKAVKRLASLPNTQVKISYNSDRDRLHAKAYLFLRNSGFHTAYIGSSNISGPALTEGLEWNIKVTEPEMPEVVATIKNSFETYWNDEAFETYTPGKDDDRLKQALSGTANNHEGFDYSVLDLMKAKEYQTEILERLEVERSVHGHFRNLVVAATGTGKTVISAFDFKRYRESNPDCTFLFVVHREEIIKQACATFRQVLGDPNFGDMWYGDNEPTSYKCLFASKDMLHNRLNSLTLAHDYYDYIIFDEAHHIVADSYQRILQHFRPKILLGLTATPERMDGQDITEFFDGHISAEIRLATALNNGLLAPYHYYGVSDDTDISQVGWARGKFVTSELSAAYTANDNRTETILRAMEKYIPDPHNVCALCFCVDQQHAKFMNAKFTLAGLKTDILTSENANERAGKLRKLRDKDINYLFVVDMFNEGVDIPAIDTVLFLRPTESVTVFLQQFGRGLRKAEGKTHLTVLDFVGHSRAEFNYSDRFRAMIGKTSMSVPEEIDHGFPHMPLGCSITLEKKAYEEILNNINGFIRSFQKSKIITSIKTFSQNYDVPLTLANFIRLTRIPVERIYKVSTWSDLCTIAEVRETHSRFTVELKRAVYKKWLSVDSYSYFSFIKKLVEKRFRLKEADLSNIELKQALMFYYDVFQEANVFSSIQDMFNELSGDKVFISELEELIPILINRCEALEKEDNSIFKSSMPLKLHGIYTKDEIFASIGTSTLDRKSSCREGVERNRTLALEAMFVDIIKDREEGSNTNYNDFAQSREMFNWETQNKVSPTSQSGQEYINGTNTMLLFVRKQSDHPDDQSRTMGYVYLGQVNLEKWSGSRPMQILWKLKTLMPASVFSYAGKYVAIG